MVGSGEDSVFTVGHSNRDRDSFLFIVDLTPADLLIDVRSYPNSSRFHHFNQGNLRESLGEIDVDYMHCARLGGGRESKTSTENSALSPGFQAVADYLNDDDGQQVLYELEDKFARRNPILMCAEKDPTECHRSLISDHLVARGISVSHVISRGEVNQHELHPNARLDGKSVTYPGLV